MRAVTLHYGTRSLQLDNVSEPELEHPHQVLFRVHEGGVCGTDRELANFRFGHPPVGSEYLILGHEAIGQVVDVGAEVRGFARGDWVVPMVRRACSPACQSCVRHRRDLCLTGNYSERGIFGAHGYLTEFAVDAEEDLIEISPAIVDLGVLVEPLSVVEKAVETALRLHAPAPETCLVLGAGTIGILCALVMQRRGLRVTIHSLEPENSPRARRLRDSGIAYRNKLSGRFDVILEATGSDAAASQAVAHLAPLGVFVLLGAKQAAEPFPFLQLIVENQILTGSVNAGPEHARLAAEELSDLDGPVLRGLIHRLPLRQFAESILGSVSDKPKIVHVLE